MLTQIESKCHFCITSLSVRILIVLVLVIFVNGSILLNRETSNIIPTIGHWVCRHKFLPTLSNFHTFNEIAVSQVTVRKSVDAMSEEAYVEPKQIGTQFEQGFSELKLEGFILNILMLRNLPYVTSISQ